MRIVDRYRNGRIVLAGDAAHLNSPSGGMGMNGGIHDAHDLVATLADIANGGSLDLLDRYWRPLRPLAGQARTSVGKGTRGLVRVDLGGHRTLTKQQRQN